MRPLSAIRLRVCTASAVLVFAVSAWAAQPGGAPMTRGGGMAARPINRPAPKPIQKQDHLAQWMDRHRNLPLAQQQRALEAEPGFHDFPAETQQRMRDRLTQLNGMTPEQRTHLLERNEALERMTPPQRQQFRSAMQQYAALPVDRRRLVQRAFHDLRQMPPVQRQAIIDNDPRFKAQFSESERSSLSNLLAIEPYLPVKGPDAP